MNCLSLDTEKIVRPCPLRTINRQYELTLDGFIVILGSDNFMLEDSFVYAKVQAYLVHNFHDLSYKSLVRKQVRPGYTTYQPRGHLI